MPTAGAISGDFPPLPTSTTIPTPISDSESSLSDSDSPTSSPLPSSLFSSYSSPLSSDLDKIRSLLSSPSLSACLICLNRLRVSDPIWSCSLSCHASFHLPCIQSWAHHSSSCPKCRSDYPDLLRLAKSYLCYCGKTENPPADPWILPHSCGEICGKDLADECGHCCLVLCHPGPCPPCPKLVTSFCFCGAGKDTRRCAKKHFSCGNRCVRLANCGKHRCAEICHEGDCPPCKVVGTFRCLCGGEERDRKCFEREFRCERSCGGTLGCGKHRCERGCHSGRCGECPLQGKRSCPCGKRVHHGVSCDVVVPTCGATCEKMLDCGLHRCPERCHTGKCAETCRNIMLKSCRCGSLKKEVPCHQDLVCERKCQRQRDCGRHACKRRCCDGDCPPCPEICGRKLRCNNHKCPSTCHRGACAPCPLMVSISCFCGETQFEVPCGMEKDQKPPKCPKPCQIPRLCRHSSRLRRHKCHYGACPPCRLICHEEFPCGHSCTKRCHGPVPPANPEFTLKPKKKKLQRPNESTPGTPCPPCQEIVLKPCLGHHVGQERAMLCSDKRRFSCQDLCGNLLQCGNHYCTKSCHVLGHNNENDNLAQPCEECFLPCQKEREPPCQHPCPRPCHTDDCSPCKVLIKRSCHCGSMVHVFDCTYYNTSSHEEQQRIRSCNGPCHRKLPNCPHLCPEICHPGQCSPSSCKKKVTVRCACQNLKKEWQCQDVQDAYHDAGREPKDVLKNQYGLGVLPCNSDCTSKIKIKEAELVFRSSAAERTKVPDDTEPAQPKRKKRRERVKETRAISKFQAFKVIIRKGALFILITVLLIASVYYGYKGIFWLSDWMNEIEKRQTRKNFRRI